MLATCSYCFEVHGEVGRCGEGGYSRHGSQLAKQEEKGRCWNASMAFQRYAFL